MKYIITESQIDKIIFRYLDNQDFIQVENNDKIYFLNSEGDEYSQIKYDMDTDWCIIDITLVKEVSNFFSIESPESKNIIVKWVENTLQTRIGNKMSAMHPRPLILRIPSN